VAEVVGYGVVRDRGEPWRVEGYIRPDALGRGNGTLIATSLEQGAARRGARRIQNSVLEADAGTRRLLESLGYGAVRASASTRRSGASSAPETRSPPGRSVRATHTAAALSTRSSRVADGAGRASETALLADSLARLWERGEPSVGLGVDAASDTGAFHLSGVCDAVRDMRVDRAPSRK